MIEAYPTVSTQAAAPRSLRLAGVDHTARPTWKLAETVAFYRDILGLPLIHTISAQGWGPATHPDFLHFFFDSGAGSTIAFFHYLGDRQPADMAARPGRKPWPEDHVFDATHTAWLVETADELSAWRDRLAAAGVEVSVETAHEVIESIYFRDPNGYFIEITRKLRALQPLDGVDAALTLEAAIVASQAHQNRGSNLGAIAEVWRGKAAAVAKGRGETVGALTMFVPDLPEFRCLPDAARGLPACRVTAPRDGYWRIDADQAVSFDRRALGLRPAIWYGLFTGGVSGDVAFERDRVTLTPVAV